MSDEPADKKPSLKDRIKAMAEEYGTIFAVTWLAIFAVTLAGFVLAIQAGVDVENTAGRAGLLGIAYGATQLTKPLRALAAFALTPVIARVLRSRRGDSDSEE